MTVGLLASGEEAAVRNALTVADELPRAREIRVRRRAQALAELKEPPCRCRRSSNPSNPLPPIVIGYVSVRGEASFLDADDIVDPEPFYGREPEQAANAIEQAGLTVIAESRLGIAVAGPAAAYEELTGGTVQAFERLMHTRSGRVEYVTHLDIVGSRQPRALGAGAGVRDVDRRRRAGAPALADGGLPGADPAVGRALPPARARRRGDDPRRRRGAPRRPARRGRDGGDGRQRLVPPPVLHRARLHRRDAGHGDPGHEPGARPARARDRRVGERLRDRAGVHAAPVPGRRRPGQPRRRAGRRSCARSRRGRTC